MVSTGCQWNHYFDWLLFLSAYDNVSSHKFKNKKKTVQLTDVFFCLYFDGNMSQNIVAEGKIEGLTTNPCS